MINYINIRFKFFVSESKSAINQLLNTLTGTFILYGQGILVALYLFLSAYGIFLTEESDLLVKSTCTLYLAIGQFLFCFFFKESIVSSKYNKFIVSLSYHDFIKYGYEILFSILISPFIHTTFFILILLYIDQRNPSGVQDLLLLLLFQISLNTLILYKNRLASLLFVVLTTTCWAFIKSSYILFTLLILSAFILLFSPSINIDSSKIKADTPFKFWFIFWLCNAHLLLISLMTSSAFIFFMLYLNRMYKLDLFTLKTVLGPFLVYTSISFVHRLSDQLREWHMYIKAYHYSNFTFAMLYLPLIYTIFFYLIYSLLTGMSYINMIHFIAAVSLIFVKRYCSNKYFYIIILMLFLLSMILMNL